VKFLTIINNIIGGKKVMLKKHLAVMLLLVMAVAAFAQSIPSGTGRYEALGNSPFVLDAATDINNNPAWNNYYRNYAFGDIGRNVINDFALSGQYAGVTFGVGKKLNLGMILNRRDDWWDSFNSVGEILAPQNNGVSAPIVPFKGLIGYSASKNFHLGLAPYFALWSADSTTTGGSVVGNYTRSSYALGGTLGFMYMIKKGWIEGDVKFGMNKYKSELTVDTVGTLNTVENEGGISLEAAFRAWIYPKNKSKIAIVPLVGFYTFSWNPKLTAGAVETKGYNYNWLGFSGGVGLNIPVTDDIQLAGGVVAGYNTQKIDSGSVTYKYTNLEAPRFHLSGETRIADWLTGRFGYMRSVNSVKQTFDVGSVSNEWTFKSASNYDQTISLGAGFHFGRFSIDATVSEKWLKEGINFVSGRQNDLFGVVSASYNFND
jgi:hypothetical protein